MTIKVHSPKKIHYRSDYIKTGLCLALGVVVYIVYRTVFDKDIATSLFVGGLAAVVPPVGVMTVRQMAQGYKEARRE